MACNDDVKIYRTADGSFTRTGSPDTRIGNRKNGASYYPNCRVMRVKFIKQLSLDMATGAYTEVPSASRWATEACDIPIFSTDTASKTDGICKSCRSGWTHELNYFAAPPLDTLVALAAGGVPAGEIAIVMGRTSSGKTRLRKGR